MQKTVRITESQLLHLAAKAKQENTLCGYLHKKSADTGKWQLRWFALYQNLLFYYENESTARPSGVALLEGCFCERLVTPPLSKGKDSDKQYCFTIYYRKDGQRQYDLRADTEAECAAWIEVIKQASYSKVLEQKEQLEQKHLHLLQILDSERQAKWHYVQQTEELTAEVKKLKSELREYKKERRVSNDKLEDENEEIRKIKKVQSFFRGWLCRRRWKQIVDEYIRSEHAESMRKRNSIVFGMVECEEEYVKQLSALVTVFLRPLKMAASSKKPPISHEDVNSIFLNSETVLFLHQIFMKGLMARMENWPTLVLGGDLFDMLLPMLGIYQEYVRNHHYSLQVLAECKQKPEFNHLLRRYEEKSICEGRSLETFLTYPMHQIPRYIITIHELLAHTPHDHVERRSLEFAQSKLEELSQIMQDEVSETENIRKNLAIERMIVEGCDILLDVNQTFVRQGSLIQVLNEKPKGGRGRLGSFSTTFKDSKKETVRQVFLFTNHMLLTTRTSNGRLHLTKHYGKIPLIDCTLVEDSNSDIFFFDDETSSLDSSLSLGSQSSNNNLLTAQINEKDQRPDYNGLDFRLILDSKSGPPVTITLVASTLQEKAAWCSDIGQCIENLHYSDLLNSSMSETSSVTMPQSVRSDPKLFRDDVDIKFSRTLNSCKVPQIRHASVDGLLDRLTDLRFLSIDFLNTFLLTYRVFTTGKTVLEALGRVYRKPEYGNLESSSTAAHQEPLHRHSINTVTPYTHSLDGSTDSPHHVQFSNTPPLSKHLIKPQAEKMRRISTGSMKIEVTGEKTPIDGHHLGGFKKYERQDSGDRSSSSADEPDTTILLIPPKPKLAPIASCETLSEPNDFLTEVTESESSESDAELPAVTIGPTTANITLSLDAQEDSAGSPYLEAQDTSLVVPFSMSAGASSETLVAAAGSVSTSPYVLSATTSSDTLVPTSPHSSPAGSPLTSPKKATLPKMRFKTKKFNPPPIKIPTSSQMDALILSPATSPRRAASPIRRATSPHCVPSGGFNSPVLPRTTSPSPHRSPVSSPKAKRPPSPISYSFSSPNIINTFAKSRSGKRGSEASEASSFMSPRSSFAAAEGSPPQAKAGTVVTSSRASKRRSSSTAATAAFAAATAGSANPKDHPKGISRYHSAGPGDLRPQNLNKKRESVISTAATMRVLNVLRHWVSKHNQDFEADTDLKKGVKDLLEEMVCNSCLLPAEHKAAASILRVLTKEEEGSEMKVNLDELLLPPTSPVKDNFDTLSALDIAEQLTYLDHQIFMAIRSNELLCQAWMKPDKANKAPHVLLVSKRFNEVSRLVVSEIVGRQGMADRVACIEKWAAIADICRCMHNYNGVLQICAAFVNSSVYRLKKTWEKLSKQTKQMIERLQTLVSSDGRFRNMRDALHRSDPPCIPYLGMYLTDLSFIEEGTPNVTEDHLINFSKMRMIAHVIREIQVFQQTAYRIEHHKRVTNYLLDTTRLLDDEETYKASLDIEPRQPRISVNNTTSTSAC